MSVLIQDNGNLIYKGAVNLAEEILPAKGKFSSGGDINTVATTTNPLCHAGKIGNHVVKVILVNTFAVSPG